MSDTPETDHLEDQLGSAAKFSHPVIWKHARQLERERDEARDLLKHAQSALDAIHLEIGGWIKTMSVTSK
jgi:hypothetical protein